MNRMIELDGKTIHEGQTVTVDHVVQTFTLTVRSCSGVESKTIKDHLQKKWEVVNIERTENVQYVRAGHFDA